MQKTQSAKRVVKGILFDKDGTLFGFAAMWAQWCDRVLNELSGGDESLRQSMGEAVGYNVHSRQFASDAMIVRAAADEINQVWCSLLPEQSFAAVEAVGQKHLQSMPASVPVTDLDQLCLQFQHHDIALGVATNDFESVAVDQLREIGALSHFQFVCGFDSGFGAKPEPGMILGFCEKLSLRPAEVAMVGDSSHDLDAGRAAGVGLTVGVLTGPASRLELQELADVVLDDISQLPDYLGIDG